MGVLEDAQVAEQRWRDQVDRRLAETFDALTDHEERFNRGNDRFTRGEVRMTELAGEMAKNNEMTARIDTNTAEIREIFEAVKGVVKVGGWLGRSVMWAAGLAIAIGVLVWWYKTGELPKKP